MRDWRDNQPVDSLRSASAARESESSAGDRALEFELGFSFTKKTQLEVVFDAFTNLITRRINDTSFLASGEY